MTSTKPRICVLASGGGRSFENLAKLVNAGELDVQIGLVISDKPRAQVLQRAERFGVTTQVIPKPKALTPADHSTQIFAAIEASDADADGKTDLIVLAGYLKLLLIPDHWAGRVINIHPALLPAFGGKGYFGHHVHQAVLDRGVEVTGCTVHYVDNEYDNGKVLLQRWIPVPPGIDVDALAAAVFAEERQALPDAIRRHFAQA